MVMQHDSLPFRAKSNSQNCFHITGILPGNMLCFYHNSHKKFQVLDPFFSLRHQHET